MKDESKIIKVEVAEENIEAARKWERAEIEIQLPEGWFIDEDWTAHGYIPVKYMLNGKLRIGIRRAIEK